MRLDELPAEGEPKPCTLRLLLGTPDLPELLEHRLLVLRGDPHARVRDRDLGGTVDDPRSYVNSAPL